MLDVLYVLVVDVLHSARGIGEEDDQPVGGIERPADRAGQLAAPAGGGEPDANPLTGESLQLLGGDGHPGKIVDSPAEMRPLVVKLIA